MIGFMKNFIPGFGLAKIKLYLILGGAALAIVGGAYLYMQNLYSTIDILKTNAVKKDIALKNRDFQLKNLRGKIVRANKITKETREQLNKSRGVVDDLQKKFLKIDIEKAGNRNPELVENKINRATKRVLKCFEAISKIDNPDDLSKNADCYRQPKKTGDK